MCLDIFLKVSKGNNLISKSRAFHNVGAAYTKDLSKNELAHVLLIGGTHNKQGSNDARNMNNEFGFGTASKSEHWTSMWNCRRGVLCVVIYDFMI